MSEVAPFGDVPEKLSAPLKRSFVASRTYVQALKIAGDILVNINKVRARLVFQSAQLVRAATSGRGPSHSERFVYSGRVRSTPLFAVNYRNVVRFSYRRREIYFYRSSKIRYS